MRLGTLDWAVIAAYAVGMIVIGWWYSRRNRDGNDYLVGGRTMNPVAVGLSFFVALFSTITYLAMPGEMVRHGPIIFSSLLSYPFILFFVGWFIIPAFMKLKVNSGYELLETRLGLGPRMLGVTLFLLIRLMWMGVIIFATVDKVLVPLTGLPVEATPLICLAVVAVTIVYTAMGGLKAIVTVDVIQACLLVSGVLLTLGLITYKLGGVSAWWPDGWQSHWQPLRIVGGAPGERSIMAAFIGLLSWYVCTAGSDQMAVQRYLSTRDVRAARKMLGVSLIAGCCVHLVLACLGLALLGFVAHNPDWSAAGQVSTAAADKLFPAFIATMLPSGLAGLIIAGLLAEAMNSLSSGMNSSSAVITTDLIGRFRRTPFAPGEELRLLRWISVIVGLVVVLLSVGASYVEGNLLELSYKIVNLFTAPLFTLFFFAIFVPWATSAGAVTGTVAAVAATLTVNYWKEIMTAANRMFELGIDPVPPISFLYGGPISLATGVVVGMAVSRIWARK